uniref:Ribosomal protein S1 n=1 Tax=Halophila decipiens TaxID=55459 RepID=A0A1Z1R0B4_9LILI|nr:ribosomal protein S1 [Halophila decipiens]
MSLRRSFPKFHSSFLSRNGKVSSFLRLRRRKPMFLVDAGLGTPRIGMQDETVPIHRATRFENQVGSLNVGDVQSLIKERTATGFHSCFGSLDVVAGEPLLLPQQFRLFRTVLPTNKKVKGGGLILDQIQEGSSVAIAGFITLIPRENDRFTN